MQRQFIGQWCTTDWTYLSSSAQILVAVKDDSVAVVLRSQQPWINMGPPHVQLQGDLAMAW